MAAVPNAAAAERADDPNGIDAADLTVRANVQRLPSVTSDVLNALTALGYSNKEAAAAVKQVPEGLDLEDTVRHALKLLDRV